MLLLLYKKQVHLAVGRTLELLECCIDLERTRKVASSLSTKLVAPQAANRGKTNKTSAAMTLVHKNKHIEANSSVLDRSERCIDREHVTEVLCTLCHDGIGSEAASSA